MSDQSDTILSHLDVPLEQVFYKDFSILSQLLSAWYIEGTVQWQTIYLPVLMG